ncbi:DUF6950 family protein [Palleronia sp. LCG004]|uniref:DUF6950 family protein n=1 Tax=Palleronia sp. LCG004 TaxID=3079304 RepID=UPI002942D5AA|nr:hypothetical protein [Palleronia sp. LCG004]WOI54952.1 hypothetical protein RVY76_07695 [Palleronia sp. LCG004]
MTFSRLPNWRLRLDDYLARVARAAFRPGIHDCALFAAGGVEAMTGRDPAAVLRGSYRTIEDGYVRLREMGHRDHVAMAASLFEALPIMRARCGDIAVLADGKGHLALGLVTGPSIAALGLDGLRFRPLTDGRKVFAV